MTEKYNHFCSKTGKDSSDEVITNLQAQLTTYRVANEMLGRMVVANQSRFQIEPGIKRSDQDKTVISQAIFEGASKLPNILGRDD